MTSALRGVAAIVEYDYAAKEADELDLIKGTMIHSIKQMPGGWWEGTMQATGRTGMFPDNFVRVLDASETSNTVQMREKNAASNRRCKVIYSYTQVNDDELSLGVGDVIEFLAEVEEGWWRGRLNNKVGVFPSNFVVDIEPSPIFASKRPPTLNISGGSKTTTAITSGGGSSATSASSTKKSNRLSIHGSKENLLNTNRTTSGTGSTATTTTAASSAAAAAATTTSTTISSSGTMMTNVPDVADVAPSLPPKPHREYCRVEYPYAPQNDDELALKVGDIITIVTTELPDRGWWKGEVRGKVGVFPDNFVKMLAPSEVAPVNDSQPQQQKASRSATTKLTSSQQQHTTTNSTNNSSNSNSTTITNNTTAASSTTSKVFIKKSGSTSSSHSSNRKDSFGSRDSLNDILSETGLQTGNVAAQRKSLENKNFDLSGAPDAGLRLGLKKSATTAMSQSVSSTGGGAPPLTSNASTSDVRKSGEGAAQDDKTRPMPPVLSKKPTVPNKKSTPVTSVAGIFSGLKQKVKGTDNKLTTAASHDAADGVASSRMSPGGLPESAPGGHVVMRRAATIAVEDSDFDRVERSSLLPDVRAGRVKAPRRRPPSTTANGIGSGGGETNNNNGIYLNGNAGNEQYMEESNGFKSDDNSISEDSTQLAKPKPREWETKKAPWMEELKASQVKKKTSPSVEPRSAATIGASTIVDAKTNVTSTAATSSSVTVSGSQNTSSSSSNSANVTTTSTSKVQSSAVSSSSVMQQSTVVESTTTSSHQRTILTSNSSSSNADELIKSMSGKLNISHDQISGGGDDIRTRPNTLSIRNRSTSPSLSGGGSASGGSSARSGTALKSSATPAMARMDSTTASGTAMKSSTVATATSSNQVNNHHEHENDVGGGGDGRIVVLEKRIEKLESTVHIQQRTIDELVRLLREETDRVRVLRGEMDKYAQCVTQV